MEKLTQTINLEFLEMFSDKIVHRWLTMALRKNPVYGGTGVVFAGGAKDKRVTLFFYSKKFLKKVENIHLGPLMAFQKRGLVQEKKRGHFLV